MYKRQVNCTGDVYKGTIEDGLVSNTTLVLTKKGSANVNIANVVNNNFHVTSGVLNTLDGNVLLQTEGIGRIHLYTLTNRVKNGNYAGNILTIERYGGSNIEVAGLGSASQSSVSTSHLTIIPDTLKNDTANSGSRTGNITITHSSSFSASTAPSILFSSLTSLSHYGTYAGYVSFELSGSYAINEVELVLNSSESFSSSIFYSGLISFKGSTNGSTWQSLNTPQGYIYDVWKRKLFGNRVCAIFRLTKNINNYKHYKLSLIHI